MSDKKGCIRGGTKGCPFGLPISMGCKNVGKNINNMREIKDESTEELDYSNVSYNWKKFFFIITGDDYEKRRCPYADQIDGTKNLVLCSHGISGESQEESGKQMNQIPISGSPSQISVFDTNPTNNGLPLYGDSSFTDDNIRDIPLGLANVGRENSKLT